MIDIYAHAGQMVNLGRAGENGARRIVFDVSGWAEEYPNAEYSLVNQAPGGPTAYPVAGVEVREGEIRWTVTSADLPAAGRGRCELFATRDGVIVKSAIFDTIVLEALDDCGDAPEPWESWQAAFARNAAEARDAANDAEAARDEIAGITAEAVTLAPGSAATAAYDAGHLVIGVPQGLRGETGAQGPKGETYTLTAQDRRDIVEAVLEEYPAAEGVRF